MALDSADDLGCKHAKSRIECVRSAWRPPPRPVVDQLDTTYECRSWHRNIRVRRRVTAEDVPFAPCLPHASVREHRPVCRNEHPDLPATRWPIERIDPNPCPLSISRPHGRPGCREPEFTFTRAPPEETSRYIDRGGHPL